MKMFKLYVNEGIYHVYMRIGAPGVLTSKQRFISEQN